MTFLPQEIIARKRDGEILTAREISAFIGGRAIGRRRSARRHAVTAAAIRRICCGEYRPYSPHILRRKPYGRAELSEGRSLVYSGPQENNDA